MTPQRRAQIFGQTRQTGSFNRSNLSSGGADAYDLSIRWTVDPIPRRDVLLNTHYTPLILHPPHFCCFLNIAQTAFHQ